MSPTVTYQAHIVRMSQQKGGFVFVIKAECSRMQGRSESPIAVAGRARACTTPVGVPPSCLAGISSIYLLLLLDQGLR